jgi:hypothetical protein
VWRNARTSNQNVGFDALNGAASGLKHETPGSWDVIAGQQVRQGGLCRSRGMSATLLGEINMQIKTSPVMTIVQRLHHRRELAADLAGRCWRCGEKHRTRMWRLSGADLA